MNKVVLIIMDGLGDRPIPELGHLTPLERAHTPNFDRFAKEGVGGLLTILGRGKVPGSDAAHLTLFGYDIDRYCIGRGPIEVAGIGMRLEPSDVALRGNMGTVDKSRIIVDRRAGRITDVTEFARAINGIEIDGVRFLVQSGTAHRVGIIMRGENLSGNISDADPHIPDVEVQKAEPLDDFPETEITAKILNKFIERTHQILSGLEANKKRVEQGLLPANYVFVRGAGGYEGIPSFEKRYGMRACNISGAGLYKGIGVIAGMNVLNIPGATGLPNTDVRAKFSCLLEAVNKHDFAFVHIKAADSLAEDGDYQGKTAFIEKIDEAAEVLFDLPKNILLVVTGDHSTPCSLKFHSADPVPLLMHGPFVRPDNVDRFGERACALGGLGLLHGLELMPEIMNLIGQGEFIGA